MSKIEFERFVLAVFATIADERLSAHDRLEILNEVRRRSTRRFSDAKR